ncbi:MAG: lysostaphin resistance A-like protein, partial [Pseudonocardiaceae bacterium]
IWIGAIADAAGLTYSGGHGSSLPAVVGVTFTLLVAPVAEEALMRGLMYPLLRRFVPPLPALVLVTLCFAGLHANVRQSIATIGLGLLLALVYEYTRRLSPVVALHAFFNVLALLVPIALLGRLASGPAVLALTIAFSAVLWLLVHRTGAHRTEVDIAHDRQGQR